VPHRCIVVGDAEIDRRSEHVDVRIGIVQTMKELEVVLPEDVDRNSLVTQIESTLSNSEGALQLTDRRGRLVVVPVARIAYVEVGAPEAERRVGFGAP
jgi:Asp/Glu/hydantoin racemase